MNRTSPLMALALALGATAATPSVHHLRPGASGAIDPFDLGPSSGGPRRSIPRSEREERKRKAKAAKQSRKRNR